MIVPRAPRTAREMRRRKSYDARVNEAVVGVRKRVYADRKAEAQQTPMTLRQAMFVLAGYLALVGILVGVLFVMAALDAGGPLAFLR